MLTNASTSDKTGRRSLNSNVHPGLPEHQSVGSSLGQADAGPSTKRQSQPSLPQIRQRWSMQKKSTIWALAISVVPVLAMGMAIYVAGQTVERQVNQSQSSGNPALAQQTVLIIQQQRQALLIGTGVLAGLTGRDCCAVDTSDATSRSRCSRSFDPSC